MRKMLALFMAAALVAAMAHAQVQLKAALKIVVIEGEDAVNIIQQKTAVARSSKCAIAAIFRSAAPP